MLHSVPSLKDLIIQAHSSATPRQQKCIKKINHGAGDGSASSNPREDANRATEIAWSILCHIGPIPRLGFYFISATMAVKRAAIEATLDWAPATAEVPSPPVEPAGAAVVLLLEALPAGAPAGAPVGALVG